MWSLSEVLDRVVEEAEKQAAAGDISRATLHRHQWGKRYWLQALGDRFLTDFEGQHCYELLTEWRDRERARGMTGQSLKSRQQTLRLVFSEALRAGFAVLPPSEWPKIGDDYRPRETYLLPSECDAVLEQLPLHRALYAALTLATAMHKSDLEGDESLHRAPYDRRQIHLNEVKRELTFVRHNSKSKAKPKTFLVPKFLAEYVLRYWEAMPTSGPVVAPWVNSGRELTDAARRAGVKKDITLTDLRRTCATWVLERNASHETLFVLRDFFGHSQKSKMLEQVYARVTAHLADKVLRSLG